MDFETLGYEVADGVATITLDRPERHNAFNLAMADELKRAWQAINEHGQCPDLQEGAKAFVEKRKPRWVPYTG